jgi:hypothetical protein
VAGIGLYNYKARYYDPLAGRFLSADNIDPKGPQELNRYSYVLNNPISNNDPTGHECIQYDVEKHQCTKHGYDIYPTIKPYPTKSTPQSTPPPRPTPTPGTKSPTITQTPTLAPTVAISAGNLSIASEPQPLTPSAVPTPTYDRTLTPSVASNVDIDLLESAKKVMGIFEPNGGPGVGQIVENVACPLLTGAPCSGAGQVIDAAGGTIYAGIRNLELPGTPTPRTSLNTPTPTMFFPFRPFPTPTYSTPTPIW